MACVAAHHVVLTVNRLLLDDAGRDTGVAMALPPRAELLVPAYLLLAVLVLAAALSVLRRVPREVPDTATARR